jgi:hypothetical protein
VFVSILLRDFKRFVRAAIVDNRIIPIAIRLRQHALDAFAQVLCPIENRSDHAYEGQRLVYGETAGLRRTQGTISCNLDRNFLAAIVTGLLRFFSIVRFQGLSTAALQRTLHWRIDQGFRPQLMPPFEWFTARTTFWVPLALPCVMAARSTDEESF